MNRLLDMPAVRAILGMEGRSNRLVQRRLKAIADERAAGAFQLFKVGKAWCTTAEDLHRLLPELVAHDLADGDSLRALVERLAVELREVRARLERVENRLTHERSRA